MCIVSCSNIMEGNAIALLADVALLFSIIQLLNYLNRYVVLLFSIIQDLKY